VIFTGEAEKVLYTKGTDISVDGLLKVGAYELYIALDQSKPNVFQ